MEISELTLNLAGKLFISLQRLSDHIIFQGTEDIHSETVPRPKTLGCVWYLKCRMSWNRTAVNAWNTARLLLWRLASNMVPLFQSKPVANSRSGYYNWLTTCKTRGKYGQRFIKWYIKCVCGQWWAIFDLSSVCTWKQQPPQYQQTIKKIDTQ